MATTILVIEPRAQLLDLWTAALKAGGKYTVYSTATFPTSQEQIPPLNTFDAILIEPGTSARSLLQKIKQFPLICLTEHVQAMDACTNMGIPCYDKHRTHVIPLLAHVKQFIADRKAEAAQQRRAQQGTPPSTLTFSGSRQGKP